MKRERYMTWLGLIAGIVLAGCQAGVQATNTTPTPFQPLPAMATGPQPEATLPQPLVVITATQPAVEPSALPTLTATLTEIPSPTPLACLEEGGRMEQHTTEDGAPLTYRVYLPPCYGQIEGARYPVLYILHGQTYTDDQWDRLGMDEAAEAMIRAGEAPPFLIVMPLEADTLGDIFVTQHGRHVAEELVPWIDARYATCPERDCRAIGGLSRGGAWALNTGFDYWNLFSAVGLHSTPPFVGQYRVHQWVTNIPTEQLPRLWLDTGKQDWYLNYTTEFEAILVAENVPHEWTLFDGTHDEAYWSSHVRDYLAWYTGPWRTLFPNLHE